MKDRKIEQSKNRIESALSETYGVKPKGFNSVLRKTGKNLPYKLRKEAQYITEAEAQMAHPRTQRLVDHNRIRKAEAKIGRFTSKQDPSRDRSRALYGFGSRLVINLALAGVLLYALLQWMGVR